MVLSILDAVDHVNGAQKRILVEKAIRHFEGDITGRTFAIWGLSFKPKTDDMREAPSITIVTALLEAGAKIRANDPVAMNVAREIFGDSIEYCARNYDALDGDALLLLTEWNEFRYPDYARMKRLLVKPVVFDGRNSLRRPEHPEPRPPRGPGLHELRNRPVAARPRPPGTPFCATHTRATTRAWA